MSELKCWLVYGKLATARSNSETRQPDVMDGGARAVYLTGDVDAEIARLTEIIENQKDIIWGLREQLAGKVGAL